MIALRSLTKTGMLVGLLLLVITSCMADIRVEVNGRPLSFSVPPTVMAGRTIVPLRGIFEALGAQVNWDESTSTITGTKGDTNVRLVVGAHSATVNGRTVYLDAPATIIGGSTMVPLRFVSEALGADVRWFEATQTVSITTGDGPTTTTQVISTDTTTQATVIPEGTVIPVRLDKALSSETSRKGDPISVTVVSAHEGDAEFPRGTTIRGVVSEAQQASSDQPGMLDLAFQRVVLPDGHVIATQGSLVSLDEKTVMQTSDGRLAARNKSNQLKFIGIGAAGGLVLGKLTKHTVVGTLLGAAAGYLYSENSKKKMKPTDVSVAAGTEFGVQLNSQLTYNPSRAFVVARADNLKTASSAIDPTSQSIRVTQDGRGVSFPNSQPVSENGIVLVPLAPVMDQAQIAYKYDEHLQAISLDTDQGALQMNIGKSYALLNGEREDLEAPAQVRDGVIYVPLHFLALATGTRVVWVADNRTVTLYGAG